MKYISFIKDVPSPRSIIITAIAGTFLMTQQPEPAFAGPYPEGFITSEHRLTREDAFIMRQIHHPRAPKSRRVETQVADNKQFIHNDRDAVYSRIAQEDYTARVKALETRGKYVGR